MDAIHLHVACKRALVAYAQSCRLPRNSSNSLMKLLSIQLSHLQVSTSRYA